MKNLVTISILLCAFYLNAQTTPIPDPAFESKLISLGIDTNGMNGNILNSDAEGVLYLDLSNSGISDLTGIEAFVDIANLDCQNNMLTSLDLTFNTDLQSLFCNENELADLNILANDQLISLQCSDNLLTTLNVSGNPSLNDITCVRNLLTDLDLSTNAGLYQIVAHENQLTSITFPNSSSLLEVVWLYDNNFVNLDLTNLPVVATLLLQDNALETLDLRNGNNTSMHTMDARQNPNLEFICVDNVAYSESAPNWNKDATSTYTKTCDLGIEDFAKDFIAIYPNPVDALLNVTSRSQFAIVSLELINILGQTERLPNFSRIDLSKYKSGVYFLRFSMENGSTITRRIIKL